MVTGKRENQAPSGLGGPQVRQAGPIWVPFRLRPGFTLMELLIVIAFIALLAMMAVPMLASLAPSYMVRSSARSLDSLMQRARLMAYNTQKPIRLVVDCRFEQEDEPNHPTCIMSLYSANFTPAGALDVDGTAWSLVPDSRRTVSNRLRVDLSDKTPVPTLVSEVIGSDTEGYAYWAVFLPTGRVRTQYDPFRLVFSAKRGKIAPVEVGLSQQTGRVTIRWK